MSFSAIIETTHQETTDALIIAAEKMGADPACSLEPIHIPGTIQPHGAMLVADPSRGWTVVAASGNMAGMLATPASAGAVFGRSIGDVLGLPFTEAAQKRLQDGKLRGGVPWQSTLKLEGNAQAFDASVHSHPGLILVELERAGAGDQADAQTVIRRHQEVIVDLRETGNDLDELALVAARGVRFLTGYELDFGHYAAWQSA